MIKSEAIAEIEARLGVLSEERLQALLEMMKAWSRPTVYSTLSDAERAELDAALDSLDRGEGVDIDSLEQTLEAKLKAAGV